MLEHVGQYVVVNGTHIPAANIQVEGVPGFIIGADGRSHWYGVYFEIMFEDGTNWTVEQGVDENRKDIITLIKNWPPGHNGEGRNHSWIVTRLKDWDELVERFNEKRLSF